MKSGIYKITIGGRFYIGSSNRLTSRKSAHYVALKNKTHPNVVMQRAFNKHGDFNFEVIAYYEESEIRKQEQILLDEFINHPNCMNICSDAISQLRTKEGRQKTIAMNKSRVWTEQSKQKLRSKAIGRKIDVSRRRSFNGTENPNAKLTDSQIAHIRKLREEGTIVADLANMFNVHRTTIQRTCRARGIKCGKRKWTEIQRNSIMQARARNPKCMSRDTGGDRNGRAKLNAAKVAIIKALIIKGVCCAQIGREHGVKPETIYSIKSGRSWSDVQPALLAEYGRTKL